MLSLNVVAALSLLPEKMEIMHEDSDFYLRGALSLSWAPKMGLLRHFEAIWS